MPDTPATEERAIRRSVQHPGGGQLRTKQAAAAATDVNQIMARWVAHGTPLPIGNRTPTYGDFSNALDFHGAQNLVRQAEQDFLDLPASVRKHCRNDPGEFLEMVYDPERRDELVALGLVEERIPEGAKPDPEPAPTSAPEPTPTP